MRSLQGILSATLLLATLPAVASTPVQYGQYQDGRASYHDRRSEQFDRGLRNGGRGGSYYDERHAHDGYDDRYRNNGYNTQRHEGGIGPGKGALIGGAGGAALGALFGGGLKGSIIGGAAGAGIGAVVGKAHQNNERRDEYYPR